MRRIILTAAVTLLSVALQQQAWADNGLHPSGHDDGAKNNYPPAGQHDEQAVSSHWSAPASAQAMVSPVPTNQASVQRGEGLYSRNCTVCHGEVGEGDGPAALSLPVPPANLFEMAPRHSDGEIAWKIANGRGSMPAWDGVLASAQIWDLVNYLRSLVRVAAGSVDPHPADHTHD